MGENFSIFNIPNRIRPLMANNFGYGTGIFYPQLLHLSFVYVWKILNIVSFPISGAIILVMLLITVLSSYFMYKLLSKLTKNNRISTLCSIIYITYPYFIGNLYRRSALCEVITFLALPLIFLGIYYLFYEKNKTWKFYIYFISGYLLILNSHLISSVYITLFAGIFILFQGREVFKKEKIVPLLIASAFLILLSLNTIIPILEHKILGNYMVFVDNHMFSRGGVIASVLSIKSLLFPVDSIPFFIPITFIIVFLIFIFYRKKFNITGDDKKKLLIFISLSMISLALLLIPFLWKIMPSFLLSIQFSWRIVAYLAFFLCIILALVISSTKGNFSKIIFNLVVVTTIVTIIFTIFNSNYILRRTRGYSIRDDGMGWSKEYLPVNSYKNKKYYETRDESIKTSGNADVKIISNDTPNLVAKIILKDESIKVEIPRLYYLWYKISLKTDDDVINLDYYENKYGFIEINIPKSGVLEVGYEKTFMSKIAEIISIGAIPVCGLMIFRKRKREMSILK